MWVGFGCEKAVQFLEIRELFPVDGDLPIFPGRDGIAHMAHGPVMAAYEPAAVAIVEGDVVS